MTIEPRVSRIRKPKEEPEGTVVDGIPDPDAEEIADEYPKTAGVTPRDLRRARRKAKRLGLNPVDDHDALRLLREKGIDPASGNGILDMVPQNLPASDQSDENVVQLPAESMATEVGHPTPQQPVGFLSEAERTIEIAKIQRQLVKRRRRRLAMLLVRLAFFVILPTFLVGNYYYNDATEMFETKSEFVVQTSENQSSAMGGFLSGTGFATSKDSIAVQGFLTSREAMRMLDAEHQFIAHFSAEDIDSIQRLPEDASEEDAFKLYQKRVSVGFDPTEGIIRMAVVAANPEASQRFSEALVTYAEDRVDTLSAPIRQDQMAGAQASYDKSEADLARAQERVVELQQQRGVLSAEAEVSGQMALINSLELERETKLLDLAQMKANSRPNTTRINVMEAEIDRLSARIQELRDGMTQSDGNTLSLARITGELRVAESDLMNRQLMLQTALQQLETARIEANRQVRYLSISVTPTAPDVATYPRKFENTLMAFVIFTAIYIMVSLTVSILREQVSV